MSKNVFTMIVRHGTKENVTGYTLISPDYQTITASVADIIKGITSKKYEVTNLAVEGGKLVGTNGALDKYTLINPATGQVEGTPKAVILNRTEIDGKLAGYTVFTQMGSISLIDVKQAVTLCNNKLISNGKIRHTQDGDIVSAIGGNYPLMEVEAKKAPKGKVNVDIIFFGKVIGTSAEYFGAIVSGTSATEMSTITDTLSKSNAKIIADAVKVGGQSVRQSLAIRRFGANGVYGVFEISKLEQLVKSGATVENKIGNIVVSAVKYSADGSADEATVKLTSAMKPVDKTNAEDKVVDKSVKDYTAKIVKSFGSVIK